MSLPHYACGITTVDGREESYKATLASLDGAGFYLHTFKDSYPRLGTFGNWYQGAVRLYVMNPLADRYIIFQDDLIAYPHLRDFLDTVDVKDDEYYNLYTYRKSTKDVIGWHHARNHPGKGALALMFSNKVLRTLLSSNQWVDMPRFRTEKRKNPKTNLDGSIVDCMKTHGIKEMVHMPSLVQHTGTDSSIGHNGKKAKGFVFSPSFMGEDYDARQLIGKEGVEVPKDDRLKGKKKPMRIIQKMTKRIGLAGFCCATGLGSLNQTVSTYAEVDKWLIKPHRSHRTLEPPNTVDTMVCMGSTKKMKRWLSTIDTLLFFEVVVNKGLLELASSMGKHIVCVPMIEWLPDKPNKWTHLVDLFICPTKQCYDLINAQETPYPSVYFPWPIDTEKFKFKQRTKVEKFLFINGKGGWGGRKGGECIRKAKEIWPEMPLVVISQDSEQQWPEGTEIIPPPADNANLYDVGDILLAPHTVDGIGLEPLEAMATGMPVIITDGDPWNENLRTAPIASQVTRKKIARVMDWHLCDPHSLVSICKGFLGNDLTTDGPLVREWAEGLSWNTKADLFTNLVRTGVPTNMGDKVCTS